MQSCTCGGGGDIKRLAVTDDARETKHTRILCAFLYSTPYTSEVRVASVGGHGYRAPGLYWEPRTIIGALVWAQRKIRPELL